MENHTEAVREFSVALLIAMEQREKVLLDMAEQRGAKSAEAREQFYGIGEQLVKNTNEAMKYQRQLIEMMSKRIVIQIDNTSIMSLIMVVRDSNRLITEALLLLPINIDDLGNDKMAKACLKLGVEITIAINKYLEYTK